MKKDRIFFNWFKKSIRIVGMHPKTYEEAWRFKLNNVQLLSFLILIITLFLLIAYFIFVYTPLGYLLPETIKNKNKQKIEMAISKATRLENKIIAQDKYIQNLQKVILGEITIDSIYTYDENFPDIQNIEIDIDTATSDAEIELDEKLTLRKTEQTTMYAFDNLFFYDPIEGEISQNFRPPNHLGVDIVPSRNSQIKACLSGVVIHSSFNNLDGHVIIIAHKNEIISVYKHAESVYVKTGDQVKTGEIIGIVGSTGEQSTGTHLHFEIWSDAQVLNPMDYFSFGK